MDAGRRILLGMAKKRKFAVEKFFQALGDRTRLRLLNLMGEQELCVCYFVEVLEEGQPKVSRHLAYLREAGIVDARREGTWMHYRVVAPPHAGAAKTLRQTMKWMLEDGEFAADRKKLARVCAAPERFAGVVGAPVPKDAGGR